MNNQLIKSLSHSIYLLQLHIVFVTKYRRKVLTEEMLEYLKTTFTTILAQWRCKLLEFAGDADHVHLVVAIHPAIDISVLINNLKSSSSRRLRNRYAPHINKFYEKPVLWHRAYFVASVGNVTTDMIQQYVEQQGTKEKPRKKVNRPV